MPTINAKFDEAVTTLTKTGLSVVHGFPADKGEKMFRELARRVGHIQSFFGQPEIMDIKPQPGFDPVSSGGTAAFPLHTDLTFHEAPPRYIAMFCIHPGEGGGLPTVSDGLQAYSDLSEEEREELDQLEVSFPAPSHIEGGGYKGPIVTRKEDRSVIRFNRKCLDGSESLQHFFDGARRIHEEVDVQPGTMMVYDNHRFLHGRTEVAAGENSKRHLKRMYMGSEPG